MDVLSEVVRGLLPTVGVSLLFGAALWAIIRADASERASRALLEAQEDAEDRASTEPRRPATPGAATDPAPGVEVDGKGTVRRETSG